MNSITIIQMNIIKMEIPFRINNTILYTSIPFELIDETEFGLVLIQHFSLLSMYACASV